MHTYIRHFGSLRKTYQLIGYTSERDHTFIDAKQTWDAVTSNLVLQVSARLEKLGRHVLIGGFNEELRVDRKTRVLFRVARSYPKDGHLTSWRVPRIDRPTSRWIVAIRLTDDNKELLDYVLIPTAAVAGKYTEGHVRFTDKATTRLGLRRFCSAEALAQCIG